MLLLSLSTTTLILDISQGPALKADAVPISMLLSAPPPSPPSPLSSLSYSELSETEKQLLHEEQGPIRAQPSQGRVRIRRRREHQVPRIDTMGDLASHLLHQQLQHVQQPQLPMQPVSSDHSRGVRGKESGWSSWYGDDHTLGGHAVLDDDDDDAGNELLDNELLDADEIDGMNEDDDRVLEEEEDDDIDFACDDKNDGEGSRREVDEWRETMIQKLSQIAGLTRKEALVTARTALAPKAQ